MLCQICRLCAGKQKPFLKWESGESFTYAYFRLSSWVNSGILGHQVMWDLCLNYLDFSPSIIMLTSGRLCLCFHRFISLTSDRLHFIRQNTKQCIDFCQDFFRHTVLKCIHCTYNYVEFCYNSHSTL